MQNKEFVDKLKNVAINYNTIYANGMFGQPITQNIINQKAKQIPDWYTSKRKEELQSYIGKGYFGFDCICVIKGIMWGWSGNINDVNGGAKYASNGVADVNEYGTLNICTAVSENFNNMLVGEYLWTDGHCGIYIGNGLCVECTTRWENCVQITAVLNLGEQAGYNGRIWKKHGKLPYIEYSYVEDTVVKPGTPNQDNTIAISLMKLEKGKHRGDPQIKTVQRILKSLGYYSMDIDGSFGNGTYDAVKNFQAKRKIAVDGIVGYDTWTQLLMKEEN